MKQFKIPLTVLALALLAVYLVAPHMQPRRTMTVYTSSDGVVEAHAGLPSMLYQDYPDIGSDAVPPTTSRTYTAANCWVPVMLLVLACYLAIAWTSKKRRPDEPRADN